MPSCGDEAGGTEEDRKVEFIACLLEPGASTCQDATYTGVRRLLLCRKAEAGNLQRHVWQSWKCTGRGYVAYREYIRLYKQWEDSRPTSPSSYPGDSGRWSSSPLPGYDRNSWTSRSRPSVSSGPRSHGSAPEAEVVLQQPVQPSYSFVGMHWIFDDIKASVNVLRFGHLSSDLLAIGAADGSLIICSVASPPYILQRLKGHTKEVTDFDWSLNNQYLCSSSLDKSVRVWSVEKGNCLRVTYGKFPHLCIRFHPLNNNFLLVGHADQGVIVVNFSTGRILHRLSLESNITAMDVNHTGQILFAGDAQGCVHSLKTDIRTGALSLGHRTTRGLHRKSSTTTVQFKNFSRLAGGPVLLVANQDGSLRFFSIAMEVDGYLSLKCSLKLPPLARNIRASFCPLLSLDRGEFIVSGNEDTNVYFYDFTRPRHPCVNKLQGHTVPAVGVAWNYGENLLATSDCEGVVIVWKKARDGQ